MKTSKMTLQKTLMTGVCALALFSVILSPQSAYSTNESAVNQKAATQVEQNMQGQMAEKRKQLTAEAVADLARGRQS